jgi:hypothetical protein
MADWIVSTLHITYQWGPISKNINLAYYDVLLNTLLSEQFIYVDLTSAKIKAIIIIDPATP